MLFSKASVPLQSQPFAICSSGPAPCPTLPLFLKTAFSTFCQGSRLLWLSYRPLPGLSLGRISSPWPQSFLLSSSPPSSPSLLPFPSLSLPPSLSPPLASRIPLRQPARAPGTMLRLLRLLLLLLLLPPPGSPEPPGLAPLSPGAPPQAPDLLYADGLRAYAAGAWAPAVALLREALRSQAALGRARQDCGARCAAEPGAALPAVLPDAPGPESGPGPAQGAWERLLLRAALRRAECLTQCGAQRLGPGGAARLRVGSALRDAFRRREPYNYLQRAYYQVREPPGPSGRPAPTHAAPLLGARQEGAECRRPGLRVGLRGAVSGPLLLSRSHPNAVKYPLRSPRESLRESGSKAGAGLDGFLRRGGSGWEMEGRGLKR